LSDGIVHDLAQFKMESLQYVLLFHFGLAVIKQGRLTEEILKAFVTLPYFMPFHFFHVVNISSGRFGCHHWAATSSAIWEIISLAFVDGLAHKTVTLIVVYPSDRAVD